MSDRTEDFLFLYNREQRQIYAYIRTLLLRPDDAEEVFQEACIAMWRSFDQFTPGTNFRAWARSIARHRVLAFCKKRRSDPLVFSAAAMDQVSEEVERGEDVADARRRALIACLESLPASDREIVAQKYGRQAATVDVAEQIGRPLNTVYKALQRIRRALLECIQRKMAAEGQP